jgi:hypothetical protein
MLPPTSTAMSAFANAMVVLGFDNQVSLFTAWDFGSLLTPQP